MVPILAVQSVEKKMQMKTSAMLGNYEFYYGAGKLASLTQMDADGSESPEELCAAVHKALEQYEPQKEEIAYLVKIIKKYRPDEAFDDQMRFLFVWGKTGCEPDAPAGEKQGASRTRR